MRLCGSEVCTMKAMVRGFTFLEYHGHYMEPNHAENAIKTIVRWVILSSGKESYMYCV